MSDTSWELPWLEEPLASLTQEIVDNRLPHALLIEGPDGLGKLALARRLSAILLCGDTDRSIRPCGQCQACRLYNAGNHPDFRMLVPEEDKKGIGIDQVRALISALLLTGQIREARVGMIYPADLMSRGATNSLLKTLEEPPAGTLLLLITSRPAVFPATIRSRCRVVKLPVPDNQMAQDWLQTQDSTVNWPPLLRLAGGAPLKALEFMQEGYGDLDAQWSHDICELLAGRITPTGVADRWEKKGASLCIDWLYTQLTVLAKVGAGVISPQDELQKAGKNIDLESMFGYADELLRARMLATTTVNKKLLLEGLLIPWTRGLRAEPVIKQAVRK